MNLHDKQRVVLIVLCIPLLCMGTFALGAVYGHLRMYLVNRDVFGLAEQLGYTPDGLLVHRIKSHDVNLFFPWDSYCEVKLYYTTPLNTTAFTQKVNQVIPGSTDTGWVDYSWGLYEQIGLTINEPDVKKAQHDFRQHMIVAHTWPLRLRVTDSVTLYDTANMSSSVEYKGRRIQGNIVELYKSGGRFPIWTDCPYETTELTPPSQ